MSILEPVFSFQPSAKLKISQPLNRLQNSRYIAGIQDSKDLIKR